MNIKAISLAIGTALFLPTTGVMAAAEDGVRCPSGSAAEYSSNGVLKCVEAKDKFVKSTCPSSFPIMRRLRNRADVCTRLSLKVSKAPFFPPFAVPTIPDAPGRGWQRAVDAHSDGKGEDLFKKTQLRYVHPDGASYTHNPARGVKCPSGFRNHYITGHLKCQQTEVRRAHCLSGSLVTQRGEDFCRVTNKRIGTRPAGVVSQVGWSLSVDRFSRIRDAWTKLQFDYPTSAR